MKKQIVNSTQNLPGAWIVNPKDRGRKAIKNGRNIYLNDGQEFQIELFNPMTSTVMAEIKIDKKTVSAGGLILRPGQRIYLDCFIADRKKFIFKTYFVEDSESAAAAIADNGLVEVKFFEEDVYVPYSNGLYYSDNITYTSPSINYSDHSGGILRSRPLSKNTLSSENVFFSNTIDAFDTSSMERGITTTSSIETGRIEKGDISSQQFTSVYMNFKYTPIAQVEYKLLPESQRPIETSELKKNFCSECGFKLKGTEKFCPSCGEKL